VISPSVPGLCLAALAPRGAGSVNAPTARQVVERIQKQVGVPWRETTVDTFKAGDPDAPVKGIAVTMMATLDVLQRAARAGCTLVITHEPVFYGHFDRLDDLQKEGDPVLAAKLDLIHRHGLVVWRFHDHWHLRRPDGILTGMVRALGWERHQSPEDPLLFTLPETTLASLAARIRDRLGIRALRVVGDPNLGVARVGLAPGAPGFSGHRRILRSDAVQVMVMGEGVEWETIPYAADAVTAGMHKALIILGHIPSEQAGMEECARWLKGFLTQVPVKFIPAREPFWTPDAPPAKKERSSK